MPLVSLLAPPFGGHHRNGNASNGSPNFAGHDPKMGRRDYGPYSGRQDRSDVIRDAAGVHERTFLQRTPHGDFVILTLEGDDPAGSWAKMMELIPDDWKELMTELHGINPNSPPPPLPELVYDSKA